LIGGGTGKVMIRTGKDEGRVMLTEEKIQQKNMAGISKVFDIFLNIGGDLSNGRRHGQQRPTG
jgi:tyrosyl-tRNA synthetase